MQKDGVELSYEPSLLVAEALYWDKVEEEDDGIPRRYGTIKQSDVQLRVFEAE